MRAEVNLRRMFRNAASALLLAARVSGEEAAEERWVPGLGIRGGALIQDYEQASVESFEGSGRRLRPDSPDASDSERSVEPFVGAPLELMSPALEAIPGKPRVFLQAGLRVAFSSERNIAQEGNPTGFDYSVVAPRPPSFAREDQVKGVGSRTTSWVRPLVWDASLGLAFPFEFMGRHFRLRPSAGWIRYGINVEGLVLAVRKRNPANNQDCQPGIPPCNPREITLYDKRSLSLDGIGPGLELEMDVVRAGPVGFSLFLGGDAYRVLGKRDIRFSKSATFTGLEQPDDSLPPETYTANWAFETDPWVFSAGVGVRFHWFGAESSPEP